MRFALTLAALSLLCLPLNAADITGKWSGTLTIARPDGTSRAIPTLATLKQDGTALAGTIGGTETDQRAFRNGKVEGDEVTFEIESGNGTLQRFSLQATPEQLDGDVRASTPEGERAGGRLSLKRIAPK
jgi:hypothetical protein